MKWLLLLWYFAASLFATLLLGRSVEEQIA
jgi:hypothetical protein